MSLKNEINEMNKIPNFSNNDNRKSKIEYVINEIVEIDDDELSVSDNECLNYQNKWKTFPLLAKWARDLSIQASSAAVERMFSISGHIFSNKWRRIGMILFSRLILFETKSKFTWLI